jgi:hypothetical protein
MQLVLLISPTGTGMDMEGQVKGDARDIDFFSGKQYPDFFAERKRWKQLVMRRPARERGNAESSLVRFRLIIHRIYVLGK